LSQFSHHGDARLLTFEVSGALYALPISGVLEVMEPAGVASIPTLPRELAGVINYHGDALPVLWPQSLLGLDAPDRAPGNVLVMTDRHGDAARLGIPIDRVLGLVAGSVPTAAAGDDAVVERRSIDGRVASVLDPRRLVAKAKEVIEASLGR
jgi:chemotaxis signal transduction protein